MQAKFDKIQSLKQKLDEHIISLQNEDGYWDGKLSSSALSTAIAVFALWQYDSKKYNFQIASGLKWLMNNSNLDGGWGDTIRSKSNLSTTLLTWACLSIVKNDPKYTECLQNAENWLTDQLKELDPKSISTAVLNHYQKDQTFSVPILAMCALSGRLGEKGWDLVPQLPFQMAIFPDRLFKFLNLSVVSYAIPALIAIGLVKSVNTKNSKPIAQLNKSVKAKVLKVLAEKQPDNGGFLEATPLTGFVLMSLIGAGEKELEVCSKASSFLCESIREDGSWPIDTHLATWVTSLSLNALADENLASLPRIEKTVNGLVDQQLQEIHPFTKAQPGGWAWTHLQGGVPDADDTSGALIALHRLKQFQEIPTKVVEDGINWLLKMQNSDGGMPTFCKGWGKLPFDCSCPDITAHAMKAISLWGKEINPEVRAKIHTFFRKSWQYIKSTQQADGSWLPLWFGNEDDAKHHNPVYGTSIVLYSLICIESMCMFGSGKAKIKAMNFLLSTQNQDGGWGGNDSIISTIEETALAIRALSGTDNWTQISLAINWLHQNLPIDLTEIKASPIGLYFASLWYFEDMYPLVFASSALKEVLKTIKNSELVMTT
ncbi:prenyltransferase/squalene oxidase repeat-containing protein [Labilibaculum sp.]|uniref:prenyltransferase/squalene oxidase repeat-containing protein n=1 Tax=Labilibaculum sp. TaxID=2060723 RepID=UPI0035644E42